MHLTSDALRVCVVAARRAAIAWIFHRPRWTLVECPRSDCIFTLVPHTPYPLPRLSPRQAGGKLAGLAFARRWVPDVRVMGSSSADCPVSGLRKRPGEPGN